MKYSVKRFKCKLVSDGRQALKYDPSTAVNSDEVARDIIKAETESLPGEAIIVVYLDGKTKVLGHEVAAKGGMHGAGVTARDLLRGAIAINASAIIIGHNHPSGDPTPSREDIAMTRALSAAAKVVGVPLLDHVIVARGTSEFTSLATLGCV